MELLLRRGLADESYIFNPSGQRINLRDLLCVCRLKGGVWVPCGNPVKDSMETKTRESTSGVAGVIYAEVATAPGFHRVIYAPSKESREDLDTAAARFAALLRSECGARDTGWLIL